jgi:hypothetical protein
MSVNPSRFRILDQLAIALAAAAVLTLACLAFPLFAGSRLEVPTMKQQTIPASFAKGQPDAGSSQRVQRMESELEALQKEAAKNPSRPTVAEMERELDRLVAERQGRSQTPRLERLLKGSVGLTLLLALALSGLALSHLKGRRNTPSAA